MQAVSNISSSIHIHWLKALICYDNLPLQEVQPSVGESLCKLFTLDGSSDYERVISRIKRKREALQAKGGPINKATRLGYDAEP